MINPSTFNHGHALLIGIGGDLPVTVQDATALRTFLIDPQRCAYPDDQVKLLTEDQAHRKDILDGLDWLIDNVQKDPEAMAIVYFSGHGGLSPTYHLVPTGYNAQDIAATAISGAEFTEKIRAIQAKKLLILLDCCHAAGMATAKTPGFVSSPLPPEISTVLSQGSGRVIIASSRKNEVSYTGEPYSVFTLALLEGLAGYDSAARDGYAYVADVAMHVGRMVPNRTQDQQHPILDLHASDNFALAYYAGGEKSPKPLMVDQTFITPIGFVDVRLVEGYRSILKQYQNNLLTVEARIATFYDQAAVPLDLERTRTGILQKLAEIETTIKEQASKLGRPSADNLR